MKKLSKGAIVSIIIGAIVLIVGAGFAIYYFSSSSTQTSVGSIPRGVSTATKTPAPLTDDGDVNLDQADLNQPGATPHGSFIIDDVDEALVGTWQLESQTVVGSANPFKGHILTINADGTMVHDYTSEHSDRAPGCTVSGSVPAHFTTTLGLDLDQVDAGNEDIATFSELHVTRDSATNPTVVCPGADVTVTSNSPAQPLGTGPAITAAGETFVPYTYTLDEDWTTLTIKLENPATTYVYQRVN